MTSIITPYTRELLIFDEHGCADDPGYNHDTYDIFVMRTRLIPFIHKYLGKNYDIKITFEDEERVARIHIIPVLGSKVVPLTGEMKKIIQKEVDEQLSFPNRHALIFSTYNYLSDKNFEHIPIKWVEQIIRYIDVVPSEFAPVVHNFSIYADLGNVGNFNKIYEELHLRIIEQIREMYHKGCIPDAEKIEKDWSLVPISQKAEGDYPLPVLFQPTWTDTRFAPHLVEFLYERLAGRKTIILNVGSNNVSRFGISKALNEFKIAHYYQDNRVFVHVDNFVQAESITNLILNAESLIFGKVFVMISNRLSWIKIYNYIAQTSFNKRECTSYLRRDTFPQIIFSCKLDMDENIDYYIKEFERRAIRVLLDIQNKNPGLNPHEVVENPNFSF
jgi:hypothetical protein